MIDFSCQASDLSSNRPLLPPLFCAAASLVVLIYDPSRFETWGKLVSYHQQFLEAIGHRPSFPFVVVANKMGHP